MPRLFIFAGKMRWLAGAALLVASLALDARAQSPPNPLRPSAASPMMRIVPVPSDPPVVRTVSADDEPQSELPSIVPQSLGQSALGQPELLPAPAAGPHFAGDHFTEPNLSDGSPWQAQGSPWQQQVHPLFAHPWFAHGDPNDPYRHIGLGQPLIGTSWRNRPLYFGAFVGGIMMDDIVPGRIYQNDTAFVGLRIGYDFDHYWGMEMRGAFARPDLANGSGGSPFFPASRDNFADVDLLFYPFGDARWRPYLLAGLGFQTFRFNNLDGKRISEAPLDIPLGFGVKYFYSPQFTLRFDFVDNICLGNARISGMNNVAFMCGAEFRFGGRRPSYFPWHNNTSYW
jgi:hypothetical protein